MTPAENKLSPSDDRSDWGSFNAQCSLDNFSGNELEILRQHGMRWHALANGSISLKSQEDERILTVIQQDANPISVEERVCAKYFNRIEFEGISREIPHYELHEEGEDWYSRERCRIGIHIPDPKNRIYFNRRRHP